VDRWACVSVPALPLQLVMRHNIAWRGLPTVVVSEDKPQGKVLWANAPALAAGVLTGHSFALALSSCAGLRACVVSELEVSAVTQEIKALLWRFSPNIEVSDDAGVFWLDASGLNRLYVSLETWANALHRALRELGFSANIVVGFSRFGTYALARAGSLLCLCVNAAAERASVARVPLARLDIEPEFRDVLAKLGVHTVEALLCLPATGLLTRFGKTAQRLHALAAGDFAPLTAEVWRAPLCERTCLDNPESDSTRLLFVIKRLLDALLAKLALRAEALASLAFAFKLDRKAGSVEPEVLRPAVPTLDSLQLMDLVRLRMESLQFVEGVVEVVLNAEGVPTSAEQLKVFADQPRRDLAAADRAIARLRAEFGSAAVVRAVLCDGHLPEACFTWEPVAALCPAVLPALQPMAADATSRDQPPLAAVKKVSENSSVWLARRPLVRRIFRRPEVLSAPARELRNDGWLIRGAQHGPVTHSAGPYLVNGGWWLREVQREYQFLLTRRGEFFWVYQDKRRRRWFLHGEVQ
jgi:protein ImuB